MYLNRVVITEKLIWLLTVFLIASFYIFDTVSFGSIILLGTTIFVFILDEVQKKGQVKLKCEDYCFFVLLFAGYCFISSIWAWDSSLSFGKGITILKILVCTFVFYTHYIEEKTIKPLLQAVAWAGFLVALFSFVHYGIFNIFDVIFSGGRLLNSFANVNAIALIVSMSIIITLFEFLYFRNKSKVKLLKLFLLLLSIIIIIATGSRKAFVFNILGIIMLLLTKIKNKNTLDIFIKCLVLFCGASLFLVGILSLPVFDGINERMSGLWALITGEGAVDSSTQLRVDYIKVGFEQFLKTPFFGIGIGNSGILLLQNYGKETYLHNNYVEIMATGGICGFIIYYSIYAYCLLMFIKFRHEKDVYNKICVILILLQLVMDFGEVSYYSKYTYFYIMIFFIQIKKIQIKKTRFENEILQINQICSLR